MRKLDFISGSPSLSIFKEGSNKTNAGGIIFVLFIIIFLVISSFYIYEYITKNAYEFDYMLVKGLGWQYIKEPNKANFVSDTERKFHFLLSKEDEDYDNIPLSNNFIILEDPHEALAHLEKDPLDQFKIIDLDNDNHIYRQNTTISSKIRDFDLAVLYKCQRNHCEIREEDKIKTDSYWLTFGYQGYTIDHQSPGNPIQLLPDNTFWPIYLQFLESTNIIYLNWILIEYEEKKTIFSYLFDKIRGKPNIFYGGDFSSKEVYTDDGHVRDFLQKIGR